MSVSAQRIEGKLKREIADEAFHHLGATASVQQVDDYFRKYYKLPHCERSMYASAKRRAEGKPPPLPRRYRGGRKTQDVVSIVVTLTQLANDVGDWDQLIELIQVLKGRAT